MLRDPTIAKDNEKRVHDLVTWFYPLHVLYHWHGQIVYIGYRYIYNAPQIELAVAVQRHSFSCTRRFACFRRFKIQGRCPKPKGGDWHPLIASNSAFEKPSSLKHVIRGPLTSPHNTVLSYCWPMFNNFGTYIIISCCISNLIFYCIIILFISYSTFLFLYL